MIGCVFQLQGVGAGGMDVSFSMILVDMVSLKQRPTYAAAIQIALALGLVSGALLGALVVQKGSWKWYVTPSQQSL